MSETEIERVRVLFRGRVQGVGFRATARDTARGFRVSGWVRNEEDGSVVCEVQGPRGEIAAMLAALRGRMGRLIASESTGPAPIEPTETGFEVRR